MKDFYCPCCPISNSISILIFICCLCRPFNRNETSYPLSRHLANKTVKDVNLPGINDQEAMLSPLYFANFQIAFWAKTHLRYLSSHGHSTKAHIILLNLVFFCKTLVIIQHFPEQRIFVMQLDKCCIFKRKGAKVGHRTE